mmetsp:Transcript_70064/g.150008  ORF Transcript_70064/g.150008 Transcript_70064/m.150008 type:complete len:264 (+) Transcript_70064:278-1069(+)
MFRTGFVRTTMGFPAFFFGLTDRAPVDFLSGDAFTTAGAAEDARAAGDVAATAGAAGDVFTTTGAVGDCAGAGTTGAARDAAATTGAALPLSGLALTLALSLLTSTLGAAAACAPAVALVATTSTTPLQSFLRSGRGPTQVQPVSSSFHDRSPESMSSKTGQLWVSDQFISHGSGMTNAGVACSAVLKESKSINKLGCWIEATSSAGEASVAAFATAACSTLGSGSASTFFSAFGTVSTFSAFGVASTFSAFGKGSASTLFCG